MPLVLIALIMGSLWADDAFADPRGYWVDVVATAYSPLDKMTRDDIGNPRRLTSTGISANVRPYGIAVPRSSDGVPLIPYGSKIWLPMESEYLTETRPTDRFFLADDTGAIITNRTQETGTLHIDLRYIYPGWAHRYGRRHFRIFVIPPLK